MGLDLLDVAQVALLDLFGRRGDEPRVGADLVEELLHRGLFGVGFEADLLAQCGQLRFDPRDLLQAELVDLLGCEVGRGVHPHPVDVELAAAGHLRQSHLLRRRLQVVVSEFSDQLAEMCVDSGLDRLADLGQEAVGPVAGAVGGRHEQLFETTPIALEHPDHGRDLGLRQVDAPLLLPGDRVGELPDPLGVLVEQVEVVGALLVVRHRSGPEHLVEDVQAEAAPRVGRDVEVRPVVLRRLDQHAEVPAQQPERDPVLVVDRLLVDAGQPVEQALGEGRVRFGGLERPVREVLHLLPAPDHSGGA